jgi:hypothetical protein
VFIALGSAISARRLSRELARAEEAEGNAERERTAAVNQLGRASLAEAQAFRRSGHMGQRFESLKAIQEAGRIANSRGATPTEILVLRGEAAACLALTDLRIQDEWEDPNGRPFASFDAGLETYACPDGQGNIHLGRTADHKEFAFLSGPGKRAESIWTEFSPNGAFLLAHYDFGKGNLNLVWQLSPKNNVRRILSVADGWAQFTPDSRSLALAGQDGTLRWYDLANGEARTFPSDLRAHVMAFRPDGKQLAYSDDRKPEVRILNTATGEVL